MIDNKTELATFALDERYWRFMEDDITADFFSTPDGTILACNTPFAHLLGYDTIEEVLTTPAEALYLHLSDRQAFLKELKEQRILKNFETELRRKDGMPITVVENVIGEFDEAGSLVGIRGYMFDITDVRRAEQELRAAKEQAERAEHLKTAFISNISHEIRTPLNIILGYTDLLHELHQEKFDENDGQLFDAINNAGKRLMRTVDLILSISKLQSGNIELHREWFILEELFEQTLVEMRQITSSKGLVLDFHNDVEAIQIFADRYCIAQAFGNLLDNATKFTRNGSIAVHMKDDERGGIIVDVSDTGIGMSPEFLQRLFEPYTQEDESYSRSFEGIGLGLALVKSYFDVHGARISVQSTKGKGSCFTVRFPSRIVRSGAPAS